MPITRSAKRAERVAQRNRQQNLKIKNEMKKAIKKTYGLIDSGSKDAAKEISATISKIDKAAKKRIISKARAGRLKARLAKAAIIKKIKPSKREIIQSVAKKKQPKKINQKKNGAKKSSIKKKV